LFSLNHDILHLLASYIDGTDALNVALASKAAYDFAINRVVAVVDCNTPARLRWLHQYLLSPTRSGRLRAQYVKVLSLRHSTFSKETAEERNLGQSWLFFTEDYSQASLAADILFAVQTSECSDTRFKDACCTPAIGSAYTRSLP
ncbi:uncharacterized protein BXZ73DRAFT_51985, partial [Epithele typhae]|uniref:uncharacterized protein n=1 Tax=Epithele typhae TaxID=378194 RepID=UPI002008C792